MSGTHRYFEIIVAQVSFSRQGTIPKATFCPGDTADQNRQSYPDKHGQYCKFPQQQTRRFRGFLNAHACSVSFNGNADKRLSSQKY
jgi:hypothetical protein